ncbi:MAG: tetratricopeptide repeat protein [Candidatus Acidiferrales bacterium]
MARHAELDAAGAAACKSVKRVFFPLILFVAVVVCPPVAAQSADELAAEARRLYGEKRWEEVVRLTEASSSSSADLDFYRGLALARLERWEEADVALRAGAEKSPRDVRFPRERAGVAFCLGDYAAAKSHLRGALRLEPADAYTLNFLATIYLLEGNLEAALQLWNRAGKPALDGLTVEPRLRTQAGLMGQALDIPVFGLLILQDFRLAQARIEQLGVFPRYRFELQPQPEERFTLEFRGVERNGWGASKLDALLSLFRGAPYETVHLEYYNARGAAMNWLSLLRWDEQKRRAFTSLSAPLGGDPKWRWLAALDGRNENWDLRGTLAGGALPAVNLQKLELELSLGAVESGRWNWRSGVVTAYRNFRRPQDIPAGAAEFFTEGFSLRYEANTGILLWSAPQRRFRVDASGTAGAGRYFTQPLGAFSRVGASLSAHWLPQARGDDYETQASFRFDRTFGGVTLDELFVLGVERDNDLLLRGHAGTRKGRKGSAPLGRQIALFNFEVDKVLYSGLIAVKVGPFFDAGHAFDPSAHFGSRGWLFDAGVQMKIGVGGAFQVVLSYGRDLRDDGDAFFARTIRK